ncbi:MAG: hypothetical protein WDA71_13230, partial [Actinomycetota bacterium]
MAIMDNQDYPAATARPSDRSRMRGLVVLGLALAFVLGMGAIALRAGSGTGGLGADPVGLAAPDFSLPLVERGEVSLS